MTSLNKQLTLEEAKELIHTVNMEFVGTEHNRKMVKLAIDDFLTSLRNAS